MRILYGVTGCGLGHAMRARSLATHLQSSGHQVRLAASLRAARVLRSHGFVVLEIDGMAMRFDMGQVQRGQTIISLLRGAPHAVVRNAAVFWGEVLSFDPDVVVTDFDSFASIAGSLLGRPVVSVDHQHVVDRFRHPRAVTRTISSYRLAKAVVSAKTRRCAHYIVTSFFFPEPAAGRTTLVGPIVRPEVLSATPTRGDHVVVYQTAAGDPALVPALNAMRRVSFRVYGLGRSETIGNVEACPFDEARFLADLASARAVITNGGFTTLSEAISLGKPVLSVPMRHQPEQELNAAWLERLGLGMRSRHIDAEVVASFIERADDWTATPDPRIRRGTVDAKAALDQAILEAA